MANIVYHKYDSAFLQLEKRSEDYFMDIEKYENLPIEEGDILLMYVKRGEGGSSMGPDIEGETKYLTMMINNGPIYSGVMGSVKYMDGTHLGLPISTRDIYGIIFKKLLRK